MSIKTITFEFEVDDSKIDDVINLVVDIFDQHVDQNGNVIDGFSLNDVTITVEVVDPNQHYH